MSKGPCNSNLCVYYKVEDTCFCYTEDMYTWEDAKFECTQKNSELSIVNTSNRFDFFKSLNHKKTNFEGWVI